MFRSYSENICRTDVKPKQSHHVESYSCDFCEESNWMTETDVELHRKNTHFSLIRQQINNNIERFCTICMKLQDSNDDLISHVKSRHLFSSPAARRVEREIFICDHCSNIFFNKQMLEVHILYSHMWSTKERNTKSFACPKCNKTCRLKSIWFHLQLHEIPSISLCDICFMNMPNTKELVKHLDTHPMYYKCEICNYQTTKDVHFVKHLDQHHNRMFQYKAINKSLVDKAFRKQTINVNNMMARYNIHHSLRGLDLPKFIYICILCREICVTRLEVNNHILRDHQKLPEEKKTWTCVCREEFSNQILLKHHIFKAKGRHRQISEFDKVLQESTEEERIVEQFIEETDVIEEDVIEEGVVEEGTVEVPIDGLCIINNKDQLTYIYAQIDEDQLVTIDAENSEQVIGF